MSQWHEAEQHFEKAQNLVSQRKLSQALAELRLATEVNPFNADWLVNLGTVLDEMSEYHEALFAYRRAARLMPENLQIQERLGIDLARTGRPHQALKAFARISRDDPSYEPAYCHRILVYTQLGDHDLAEEMFYTARLYREHCPRCYNYMGRSLDARKQYDKAIFCFRKCLDLDDQWPQARRRLAQAYWHKGDLEQARRHFLGELRRHPTDAQALMELGDLLCQMGRLQEAGEKYRRSIEMFPPHAAILWRYGRWLSGQHQWQDAKTAFERAIQTDPNYLGVHMELARLAIRQNETERAAEHLRAEHLLRSEDPKVLLSLANLWMDCGQDRTAIACLKRLLSLEPRHREAWLNLAVAQFRRGLYQQGIRSCEKVLDLPGPSAKTTCLAMYNLALAYERLGQFEQGLQWARRGLTIDPGDTSLKRLELRLRVFRWGWSLAVGFWRMFDPNY